MVVIISPSGQKCHYSLQNSTFSKSKLAALCLSLRITLLLEFDFPSLFLFLRRAEKTEVLSDDLLQVNMSLHSNLVGLDSHVKINNLHSNVYILLDSKHLV